jgi:hypothetical protein
MKVALTLAVVAMAIGYQPRIRPAPVHQTQAHYFSSDEEKFLNTVMVRAYNSGDIDSLKELLQYWQDAHSTAL